MIDISTNTTTDGVIRLAGTALDFGRVERATCHQDGHTPEDDATHTVMLGLVACGLAARLGHLDIGLVSQFALVHDLVEVHAGDVNTFEAAPADIARKDRAEAAALDRIDTDHGLAFPWLPATIRAYEDRVCPEARFVKAVDKIMPLLTQVLNEMIPMARQGITHDRLVAHYDAQFDTMMGYAADFPEVMAVRADLVALTLSLLDRASTAVAA